MKISCPCPFCGETDGAICHRSRVNDHASKIYFIQCLSCGATGPDSNSEIGALNMWKGKEQ